MKTVRDLAELHALLAEKPAVLIYFSQPKCGVCTVLKPKLEAELNAHFPNLELVYVNTVEQPEISGQYSVFTVPVVLVFFEGRELYRYSRIINIQALASQIERPYQLLFG